MATCDIAPFSLPRFLADICHALILDLVGQGYPAPRTITEGFR
jgi:hypothetical protein